MSKLSRLHFFLFYVLSAFAASSYADNTSEMRDSFNAIGLSGANLLNFSWRCPQLINCGQGIRDRLGCTNKVAEIAKATQMWNSRNYLGDDLQKLAEDKDAHRALRNIVKKAEAGESFHLWKSTLHQFGGDKEKAMRFLATFFQADGFYSSRLSPEINELKDRAFRAITPGIKSGAIKAYPDGVDIKKATIYHFYANAVIASNLRQQGVPVRYAAVLPIAVNEGYEFVQHGILSAARAWKGEKQRKMAFTDVYSGYAGVQFGLSTDKEKFSGPGFEQWNSEYKRSGSITISNYLQKGLGGREAFCNDVSPEGSITVERNSILNPIHQQPVQAIEK